MTEKTLHRMLAYKQACFDQLERFLPLFLEAVSLGKAIHLQVDAEGDDFKANLQIAPRSTPPKAPSSDERPDAPVPEAQQEAAEGSA